MQHHIAPTRMYIGVFLALAVFTALTVFVRLGLEIRSFTIAISIAVVKATLVILYFMHVKWSGVLTKMAVVLAVVFLGILLLLTLTDYGSRSWQPKIPGWEKHQVVQ
ncbi:MAG: cytochrome C oxidase subunit IV family protein [Acidobacteria bacterium]|nr:cytochrome C oxidase subunit IV family protein [Acidobacteriota bacterium]